MLALEAHEDKYILDNTIIGWSRDASSGRYVHRYVCYASGYLYIDGVKQLTKKRRQI